LNSYETKFSGIGRLFTTAGLERLRQANVCVIGLGGVGSWAVEALARSGIGRLTLVDLDDVCVGNTNRQLHALSGQYGKPKVDVMAERITAINSDCVVTSLHSFFLKVNADEILATQFDYVLDAMDSLAMKLLLIARCRARQIPVITVGAAGGRMDPTAIEVVDLAFSSHDRLLQEVRRKLRGRHGFPRGDQPFNVDCVLSREPLILPPQCEQTEVTPDHRLDCSTGLGNASFVTGAFGLAAAARIVRNIALKSAAQQPELSNRSAWTPEAPTVAGSTGL